MKVKAILKYPNPHLLPILINLGEFNDIDLEVFYQYEINEERSGYDWEKPLDCKLSKLLKFKDYIKVLHTDCILFHGIWINYQIFMLYALAAFKNKRIIIFTESENQYSITNLRRILKFLSVILLPKKTTYILSIGGFKYCVRDNIRYGFKKKNIMPFGYCGASDHGNIYLPKKYYNNKLIKFLYVGQLIHRKGVDILINAISHLDRNEFELYVCGTGELINSLKSLAEDNNLTRNIFFLGQIDSKKLKQIYCESDVLILPSRFDGWGAVLNEAANNSLPLIASKNVRAHHELIVPFKNGYIFSYETELTSILEFIVKNPTILESMREKSFIISKEYLPNALSLRLRNYIDLITRD